MEIFLREIKQTEQKKKIISSYMAPKLRIFDYFGTPVELFFIFTFL